MNARHPTSWPGVILIRPAWAMLHLQTSAEHGNFDPKVKIPRPINKCISSLQNPKNILWPTLSQTQLVMHNVSKSTGARDFLAFEYCHNLFRTHNTIRLRTHKSYGHTHSSSEPASHTRKALRWHLAMHPTWIQSVSVPLGLLYIVRRYSPSARGRNR